MRPGRMFTSALLVVSLATACAPQEQPFPLPTYDDSGSTSFVAARFEGTLELSGLCLQLVLGDGPMMPIWPEPTRYDAETRSIDFVDVEGIQSTLRVGDHVVLGGFGGARTYVVPPDPSCATLRTFVVTIGDRPVAPPS